MATTVLAALASAVILPYTLIRLTDIIDGTWTLAVERADLAGKELALALLKRPQVSLESNYAKYYNCYYLSYIMYNNCRGVAQ